MTKYILHGGFANIDNEENKKFFSFISNNLNEDDKVLLVYFAKKDEQKRKEKYEENKKNFENVLNGKKLQFIFATESNFINELKKCKALYIRGGETFRLLNTLKKNSNFEELIKGKIVAGDSAGAYVLSTYFYTNTFDSIEKGLGILPIKVIAHYNEEKHKKVVEKLKNIEEDLEMVLLKEFESKIFEM